MYAIDPWVIVYVNSCKFHWMGLYMYIYICYIPHFTKHNSFLLDGYSMYHKWWIAMDSYLFFGFLPATCHWLPTSPHPIFWPSIATEQRLATEEQTQITSSITCVLDSLRSSGHPKNKKTSSQNPYTAVLGMSLLKIKLGTPDVS